MQAADFHLVTTINEISASTHNTTNHIPKAIILTKTFPKGRTIIFLDLFRKKIVRKL